MSEKVYLVLEWTDGEKVIHGATLNKNVAETKAAIGDAMTVKELPLVQLCAQMETLEL